MPASNSDGLLANRAFMRAVDAARAQAEQRTDVWELDPVDLQEALPKRYVRRFEDTKYEDGATEKMTSKEFVKMMML
ncbi:hypothetical protein AK812_SmicGene5321 [Symbiodinium microadriaticum]|uniref:Uncharacterized protein n=1 Tax=Symbiodinium microadriaticum TaxID=2951 RepID=A0A1Q9EU20_SYMMI|nr:hypothetical protein AK812_SmicGene5321 [Symbiodinium microadriaticum]